MVGKRIGKNLYFHKKYELQLPQDILIKAKKLLGCFEYTIVRFNAHEENLSFTFSPDWENANEPLVGPSMAILNDGQVFSRAMGSKPQIYHHKWMFAPLIGALFIINV